MWFFLHIPSTEIKLMFPDKELQQHYFPYNRLSERLKGDEKLKWQNNTLCLVYNIYLISRNKFKIYDYIG